MGGLRCFEGGCRVCGGVIGTRTALWNLQDLPGVDVQHLGRLCGDVVAGAECVQCRSWLYNFRCGLPSRCRFVLAPGKSLRRASRQIRGTARRRQPALLAPGLPVKHHPEQRVLQCLNSQLIQCLLLSHHSWWTIEAHQDRCHLEAAQMSLLRIRPLAPKLRRAFASAAQSAEVAPTTRTQHIGVSGRVYHFEELLQERDEVGGVWSAK